jgi:hypothetical protein
VSQDEDLSRLDDPAFLAERRRVREALQALTERYATLTAEFDRRAGAQWKAAQGKAAVR